ncbi:MAG: GntP family permease [Eubacterium sp.]|nr:GntP family permease [Eubacterium sp.]
MNSTYLVFIALFLGIGSLILLTVKVKLHPFFAMLISSTVFGVVSGMNFADMLDTFTQGMGSTMADLGLIVAIGTTIGVLLEESGAAEAMAQTILKLTGKKHAALGLAITGYFVAIPVFSSSAYVLLAPLAKRLSRDTGVSMTTMAISLGMGLLTTHMFVPPTPGPLAVAGILGADLGLVIVMGMIVSVPVMLTGYFMSKWMGKRYFYLPKSAEDEAEAEASALDTERRLPSALQSFLPILLPVVLMMISTIVSSTSAADTLAGQICSVIGTPVVALTVGLVAALITYLSIFPKNKEVWSFEGGFGTALMSAGQITLIVCAGGAFGALLKASPLQDILAGSLTNATLGLLAPFIIGVVFRTAIGSGTIAMITAASMLSQVTSVIGLDSPMGLVVAMLACAAGGFMVFHGNDDMFWVISSTSDMDPAIAYKTLPLTSIVQSLVGFACVLLLSLFVL